MIIYFYYSLSSYNKHARQASRNYIIVPPDFVLLHSAKRHNNNNNNDNNVSSQYLYKCSFACVRARYCVSCEIHGFRRTTVVAVTATLFLSGTRAYCMYAAAAS